MTSNLMNRLNNLFPSDASIERAEQVLKEGDAASPAQRAKYKHFVVEHGRLVYEPLRLTVLRKAEVQPTLEKLYKAEEGVFGKGIEGVYKFVSSRYINVTRKDIRAFLVQQTPYQLTRTITKRIDKPIVADYPNQLWCMDLIDMGQRLLGHNYQFRYILTVVDAFSRRV